TLSASVFDYLRDTVLVIDEPAELEKQIRTTLDELQRDYERAESIDELALAPERLFLTPDELRERIDKSQRIELRLLGSAAAAIQEDLSTEDITVRNASFSRNRDEISHPPEGGTTNRFTAFLNRPPSAPLFLFPPEPPELGAIEVEIISRSVRH